MGNCVACVPQDQWGVVQCCGDYKRTIGPGFNLIGPDIMGACYEVKTISSRITQTISRAETKTLDDVFVKIAVAVQVEVIPSDVASAIYKLNNPTQQINAYVVDVIRSFVPQLTLDETYESKDSLAEDVRKRLEERMRSYGYKIRMTLVTDITPDPNVVKAMNEINASSRRRLALQEKAQADKIMLVKNAEAEAESKMLQGRGVALERHAIVEGLTKSLNRVDENGNIIGEELSWHEITNILLLTQYFDTLGDISQNESSTVVLSNSIKGFAKISSDIMALTKH